MTVGRGSRILRTALSNCIVGENVVLEDSELSESLIGSQVEVRGLRGTVLLGDHSASWSAPSGT